MTKDGIIYHKCDLGMWVSYNGQFLKEDLSPKKVIYSYKSNGQRLTAKVTVKIDGKSYYRQAAKMVAKAWKPNYNSTDCIIYKDGNCHNINADNLELTNESGYWRYMRRNSGFTGASIEDSKKKLEQVIREATLTLNYLKTKRFDDINKYVSESLLYVLVEYCDKTLHMGQSTAQEVIPDAIACMYDCLMSGCAIHNYERWCKKILLRYKKTGHFGYMSVCPNPKKWEAELDKLKLQELLTKYKH